jgi:hypothetical protein
MADELAASLRCVADRTIAQQRATVRVHPEDTDSSGTPAAGNIDSKKDSIIHVYLSERLPMIFVQRLHSCKLTNLLFLTKFVILIFIHVCSRKDC